MIQCGRIEFNQTKKNYIVCSGTGYVSWYYGMTFLHSPVQPDLAIFCHFPTTPKTLYLKVAGM